MVCPRMGGSGNPRKLDFERRTWVGILTSQRSPGWEIWLDRHLEKSRGSGNEWRVGAPSWKIRRIRLSQFTASKDVNDGWTKVLCCFIFKRKCCFYVHQCSVLKTCASLFHVLVEFAESQKVVPLKEGNSMVKLIKDAFGIVKQFTSIFSSTECVCNCLPKLNHAKY